ncbi:DEAD/DEAH box helicase [Candidatus Woesearchaeota archaeon]|nr:MAG: DEAD/DEAH box helicase [Candidatus Woesearchaeota archaeon]
MQYRDFTLDPFQEQAITSINKGHSVVVSAPTGSGKTLIADYIIDTYLHQGKNVIYTAPIKALSNQKFKEFTALFGKDAIGLLTGDIVINPAAPVLIMTTEIYRNMSLINDPVTKNVSYVVFDEIHYINDRERGYVWEESIIFSKPHVRFLCLSATIPNAKEFANWIQTIQHHPVDVIKHNKRNVPLHRAFYDTELGITTLERIKEHLSITDYSRVYRNKRRRNRVPPPSDVELIKLIKDKLPCLFFTFSRKNCQEKALNLYKTNLFPPNKAIPPIIRQKLSQAPPEVRNLKSSKILLQTLPHGIGFHHAGILPVVKELVEDLFSKGLINVLYTTETFAVGINMPAKTVCFENLRKYDGINFRYLNSKEYFQIAGRAGRRGIDKEGFAYAMIHRRDFNYETIKKMTTKDVEPITSQFRLSINTVLNLIKQHTPPEIEDILRKNFYTYQKYRSRIYDVPTHDILRRFNTIKKKLTILHFLEDGKLTEKGEFASRIYSDEIPTTELFATDFFKTCTEYQVLLLLAALAYESRERTEFYHAYPSKAVKQLMHRISRHPTLKKEKRFKAIPDLTALIKPCMDGESIFAILKNANLLEGDIIRIFKQMLDRIGQIKNATREPDLLTLMEQCQHRINYTLQDIDLI